MKWGPRMHTKGGRKRKETVTVKKTQENKAGIQNTSGRQMYKKKQENLMELVWRWSPYSRLQWRMNVVVSKYLGCDLQDTVQLVLLLSNFAASTRLSLRTAALVTVQKSNHLRRNSITKDKYFCTFFLMKFIPLKIWIGNSKFKNTIVKWLTLSKYFIL